MTVRVVGGYVGHAPLGPGPFGDRYAGAGPDGPVGLTLLPAGYAANPALVAAFHAERDLLVGLRHPNLLAVRDVLAEDGQLAVVTDPYDGAPVAGPLPPAAAAAVVAAVTAALGHTHRAGVAHGGLGAGSVLLCRTGAGMLPLVTDVGLARLLGQPGPYAPPEGGWSPAGDVYACGVLLYALVCGRPPEGPDPAPPAELPEPLWRAVARTLSREAGRRPDMVTLTWQLDVALRALQDNPPPPPPAPATPISAPPAHPAPTSAPPAYPTPTSAPPAHTAPTSAPPAYPVPTAAPPAATVPTVASAAPTVPTPAPAAPTVPTPVSSAPTVPTVASAAPTVPTPAPSAAAMPTSGAPTVATPTPAPPTGMPNPAAPTVPMQTPAPPAGAMPNPAAPTVAMQTPAPPAGAVLNPAAPTVAMQTHAIPARPAPVSGGAGGGGTPPRSHRAVDQATALTRLVTVQRDDDEREWPATALGKRLLLGTVLTSVAVVFLAIGWWAGATTASPDGPVRPSAEGRPASTTPAAVPTSAEPSPTPAGEHVTFVSDMPLVQVTNGFGPVELNKSIGGAGPDDGGPLTLGTTRYEKGLGAHAPSQVRVYPNGTCTTFAAIVGVDADAGGQGSVVFSVNADGRPVYSSGVLRGSDGGRPMQVDVTNARVLDLVVTDGGDGNANDHADWAAAKLVCTG